MRYRDHRGSLDDSMKTVVEVHSLEELLKHLNYGWEGWGEEVEEIKFEYSGYDTRIDWDTYYVLTRLKGALNFLVAGMSDSEFKI